MVSFGSAIQLSKKDVEKIFFDVESLLISVSLIPDKTKWKIGKELEWFYSKLGDNEFDTNSANKIAKYLENIARYEIKKDLELKTKLEQLSDKIGKLSLSGVDIVS